MRRSLRIVRSAVVMPAALAVGLAAAAPRPAGAPDPRAAAALDTALARMGGADQLRQIERARFEMMTQWQRLSFDPSPYPDQPSYERHTDVRDYAVPAWRNTRRFSNGAAQMEITDIVRDSVGIRLGTTGTWGPLNVAYVDERREIFAFAPERLLLAARGATDLRALGDTTMGGAVHARVAATVAGFPTTLFLRRGDGFLAMARYHAAQVNDLGLAPWGDMEVEMWYSRWRNFPVAERGRIAYPTQWDVRRVGRPYKRLSVLAATFNGAATPDSFTVSDSLRGIYLAQHNAPMWDVPMDSARIIDGRFAAIGRAAAAVKLGRTWVLLEGSATPMRTEREVRWLQGADAGAQIAAGIVTVPNAGLGGVAWLAERRLPLYTAPGATPAVTAILRNWRQPTAVTAIGAGRWLRIDGDSMWVEPIDLPDGRGALVAYVPSLRWLYSGLAVLPVQLDLVLAHARARGWAVERVGSLRAVVQQVPTER